MNIADKFIVGKLGGLTVKTVSLVTLTLVVLIGCGKHEKGGNAEDLITTTVGTPKTTIDGTENGPKTAEPKTKEADIEAPKTKPVLDRIVCDGNSLTFGARSSDPSNKSYPAILRILTGVSVYNLGISGQTTDDMLKDAKTEVDGLFHEGAYLVAWEGVNAYGRDHDSVAHAVFQMNQYLTDRVTKGFKVVVMLIPPGVADAPYEAWRLAYNAEIEKLASNKITVMPIPTELNDPADGIYYSGDMLHLSDAGYQIVARDVWATIKALDEKE